MDAVGLLEKKLVDLTDAEWQALTNMVGTVYKPQVVAAGKIIMPKLFERTLSELLQGLPKLLQTPGGQALRPLLPFGEQQPAPVSLVTQCPFCSRMFPIGEKDVPPT